MYKTLFTYIIYIYIYIYQTQIQIKSYEELNEERLIVVQKANYENILNKFVCTII